MRFYYFSFFGTILALVVSLVAAGIFWVVWRGVLKRSIPVWAFLVSLPAFLVLPWSEEIWVAYNFGQLCRKDAGALVSKTVEVDGFYDDTTHWWRQLRESSNYQFVESRDNLNGTLWRVEREGDSVRHFKIERPTARYHYSRAAGVPVTHKVGKQVSEIADSQLGEVIARYVRYHREAPWFFIGLSAPNLGCDGPEGGPDSKHSFLIYRDVLKPKAHQ